MELGASDEDDIHMKVVARLVGNNFAEGTFPNGATV